jgi:hypothetical protein
MCVVCKNTKLISKAFLLAILISFISEVRAQGNSDITFDESSLKFGFHAGANGFGLFYRNTVPVRKSVSRLFDISFTSVKHFKEKTILNQRVVNTSPYIYGKINRLYAIRPMFGVQKTMAEKHSKNSVGVNVFGCIGPTIGLLKPNYMDIETVDPNNPNSFIAVSVRYTPETISPNRVIGNSSFTRGLNETKVVGGLSFKSGVEFNWGYYSSEYKSLEVGVIIDYFPGRPEIMYHLKNKKVYSSFYLSIALGKNY